MAACSEEFHYEDNFDPVLVIFCSDPYGENTSQAVHKIEIDKNDYHKCSLCVILCTATRYQEDWKKLFTRAGLKLSITQPHNAITFPLS